MDDVLGCTKKEVLLVPREDIMIWMPYGAREFDLCKAHEVGDQSELMELCIITWN
jgi:hypothetical protein